MCRKKKGKYLYTCALLSIATNRPGEEKHFPNIINLAKFGFLSFKIGTTSVKSNRVMITLYWPYFFNYLGLLDNVLGEKDSKLLLVCLTSYQMVKSA